MAETILGIVAGIITIIAVILQRSAKTRLDRAREIVEKGRSQNARMRLHLETRDYEALEKDLDRQDRDLAVVLSLSRKANPPR